MEELGLIDAYRLKHPKTKAFTYESKPLKLKSRIDFFLVAQSFQNNINKVEIRISNAPDHKAIFLSISIKDEFKRGPGNWKFNNQLLDDEVYKTTIKDCVQEALEYYKNIESKRLLWELIKMEIRSKTIIYSKSKRKELKHRESAIQERLQKLDYLICNNLDLSKQTLDEFEEGKKELEDIFEKKGKEAIFRSKSRWVEMGEKPTRYFFNLEKRNYEEKVILQLKTRSDEIITDIKEISKEIEIYFSELLQSQLDTTLERESNKLFSDFVSGLDIPKVSDEENALIEKALTIEELKASLLKSFQNNKTPGDDGLPKEFYEAFFDILGEHLLNSYKEAFVNGQLSVSQRRGVITLIPKEDSCLIDLSNWRPITLLNVDYKILTKTIARRIEPILPNIIHSDQSGFIKGRYIGQNVRLLCDIMEYSDTNKLPGILLFLDFKKAFDSIEWKFIDKSLELFNFCPRIRNWISTLYSNVESGVINAGFMTNYFKVSRGVRQGCPLSPFLFVIAAELLATKIRQSALCRGFQLPNNKEAKISQFADDTTIIAKDVESVKQVLELIKEFGAISGLEINQRKTKAMWIGSSKANKQKILNFECPRDPIKFLGTHLSYDNVKNNNSNFSLKIQKMEIKLNIWLSRDLTLYGRTLLAKSLGISQLIYSASMLSVPESIIQQVQSKLFAFLWKNKKDKIKREVLYLPLSKGGLKFPCFGTMVKALRLSWISRFLLGSDESWKAIPNSYFTKLGGLPFILKCN